jgi:hypothetical protein
MKSKKMSFPYQHSFFGLGLNYKPILHEEIFNLIYHSHGGFNWSDVYEMPIWLRKYYIKKLIETREIENTPPEKKSQQNTSKVAKPPILHRK